MWLLFLEQMTMTFPFLLITLHLSHIGFTEGLTFISISSDFLENSFARAPALYDLLRQVILPLVRSYGLISSFTLSPGMMRI